MERIHRFVTKDLGIRASAVNATSVVKKMQEIQQTSPLPTVAVGRAMVGSLLLASHLKEGQAVGLLVRGQGPMGNIYAEATAIGQVRGYTPHTLYAPAKYEPGLSLKSSVGNGLLTVVRHLPFQKVPHQGTVELVSGEIGDDIAHYLHQSHQIRSIVSLGVYLDKFGRVQSAGGVLLEVMPGVQEEAIARLEANHSKSSHLVSKLILEGQSPVELMSPLLEGFEKIELPHPHALAYHCPCTKDRVLGAMTILGLEEFDDIIEKKESTEVVCQMCGQKYEVSVKEIQELRNEMHRKSLH